MFPTKGRGLGPGGNPVKGKYDKAKWKILFELTKNAIDAKVIDKESNGEKCNDQHSENDFF